MTVRPHSDGTRGIVLVLVSGILVLLASLGAAFVAASRVGRSTTAGQADGVRAHLLAQSGVERALAGLRDTSAPSYGGEDYDGDGAWAASGVERDSQTYEPARLDRDDCPARAALRPSWFARRQRRRAGGEPAPDLTRLDGRWLGVTGRLRATLGEDADAGGDTYVLKVAEAGGFWVNGGDPAFAANVGYNAVLRRILGTLAEAIDREDGANDGAPVDESDGWALVDARPPSGWASLDALPEALRPYLCLHARPDRSVIAPNPRPAMVGIGYGSWADIRLAHETYPATPGTHEPGPERLPASPGGRVVGRAPVSMEWARRRRPALVALLSGLQGAWLDESTATPRASGDRIGTVRAATIANAWTAADDCHVAAEAILAHAGPLDTWERWGALCDTIPFAAANDRERQARRDVLKANFNPNSDLNKGNPNEVLWKYVDKSDLLAYSTEFSLLPLEGYTIESAGRVADPAGRAVASATIRAGVGGPSLVRITTQREFVCEDLGDPSAPGDESDLRLPGFTRPGSAPFVTEGASIDPAWGHRIDQGTAYPGTWMDGDSRGASLQTYPAPCVDPDGAGLAPLAQRPAEWDGNLQLATVETASDETYGIPYVPGDMKMLLRFDDGYDPDVRDSAEPGADRCVPDARMAPAGAGAWDGPDPGTFLPDGCHSERGRAPAYLDRGNSDGFQGVMSFWYKQGYANVEPLASATQKRRHRRLVRRANFWTDPDNTMDQMFSLWAIWTAFGQGERYCVSWDTYHQHDPSPTPARQAFGTVGEPTADPTRDIYRPDGAHRWMLLTMYWNARGDPNEFTTGLYADHGFGLMNRSGLDVPASIQRPELAEDLTAPDLYGPHLLVLGAKLDSREFSVPYNVHDSSWVGDGADGTFDEFAIHDFGPNFPSGEVLAQARFPQGRYYRGEAYRPAGAPPVLGGAPEYFTAPVRLPPGARIERIAWTWYRSRQQVPAGGAPQFPDDYAEVELTDVTGTSYLFDAAAPYAASRSTGGEPGWPVERQDWPVRRHPPGPFRIRVVFRRHTPSTLDVPVLESPVLDDLTILYRPAGPPALLAWVSD